jgi:hypothetical protein
MNLWLKSNSKQSNRSPQLPPQSKLRPQPNNHSSYRMALVVVAADAAVAEADPAAAVDVADKAAAAAVVVAVETVAVAIAAEMNQASNHPLFVSIDAPRWSRAAELSASVPW